MANKIRLLLTVPNFDTAGSGKVVLKLAQRFDRSRFEPHICCMHDRGDFFQAVTASSIPIHIVHYTNPMADRVNGLLGCWRVSRFFRSFDLVHSFNYADDYSEALAARMAGVKWVYLKTNMMWHSRAWRLRTWLAHGVVAQNTDMMRMFFAKSSRTVALIPRGVDTTEFKPRPKVTALYGELGLPEDARVVLAVANLVPIKGINHLIDAFTTIAARHPRAWLCIVGDDRSDYGASLKEQAARGPAASRVLFIGKRPDVNAFHTIADVFILPTLSKGEGCPVAVVEAMSAGTLSIATDVPGIRDQLAEATDQLFEADNVAALVKTLDWALELPAAERQKRIQQQLEVVRQRYTLEEEVAAHETFYRRVMGVT
jgi:glycosyltransferase involved in cell wall biosynthesis